MRRFVAVAVSVATVVGVAAAPAAAQEVAEPQTLAAVGVGEVLVRPDIARVYVSIRGSAPTARGARRLANRRAAAIRRAAGALGVEAQNVRTVNVSISRRHRRARRGRPARTYFSASADLTVTVRDVDRVGRVVDGLSDAGANVYGPEFSLLDSSGPHMEATRLALVDARRRADDAAARSGLRITGIRSIDLAPGSGGFDDEGGDLLSAGGGDFGTRVEPGREEVAAFVRVVYTVAPA
jgi:uncharacterized protein